jgi:rare lipoprotein A
MPAAFRIAAAALLLLIPACQTAAPPPPPPAPSSPPPAPKLYQQEGEASWYGAKHQGRKTASGDTFDKNELTAAHRTLPFGARLRVTNLENGRTVDVVVTDRGPFVEDRLIDLSEAAARRLGFAKDGVERVRIEELP